MRKLKQDFVTLEREADSFAANVLISPKDWDNFVSLNKINNSTIVSFAKELGIKPGILAGRIGNETGKWSNVSRFRKQINVSEN
jgi:hypothetical protein